MTDENPGPPTPSSNIGAMVRQIREARRMPYTELSERLGALGQPIPVLGLRRIEKGERRVDLDEVAALAYVLGVPPIRLVFPVGDVPTTTALPGRPVDTGAALLWFTGEQPLATEPLTSGGQVVGYDISSADFNSWHQGGEFLRLFRQHDELVLAWNLARMHAESDRDQARRMASMATPGDESADAIQHKAMLRRAEESEAEAHERERELHQHRQEMQRRGMTLPQLPVSRSEIRKGE
ncbi:Helix-turn-helix domain-containing protein [Micromonospora nigra]|uniref:Helix-turn-helix domain-containing protein n=1 Tax=Micromonospora nigra TaxID=145857 RepID=A0A1C6RKU7_9ACTN|nr:helix-turn-helix transcriptional regulator [Micromonospora nigra]SCL17693.1 Helix-turn-helix domain-containing protein [Micromonospora nigra]